MLFDVIPLLVRRMIPGSVGAVPIPFFFFHMLTSTVCLKYTERTNGHMPIYYVNFPIYFIWLLTKTEVLKSMKA